MSLAGLFVYIAASPILFLQIYKLDALTYGWIFALLAGGLIGASQVNILALRRYSSLQILRSGLYAQLLICSVFLLAALCQALTLATTVVLLFALLAACGFTSPNSTVLAIAPFAKNAAARRP